MTEKKQKQGGPNVGGKVGSRFGNDHDSLKSRTVDLTGSDRAFIRRALERIPTSARTQAERDLYTKVT